MSTSVCANRRSTRARFSGSPAKLTVRTVLGTPPTSSRAFIAEGTVLIKVTSSGVRAKSRAFCTILVVAPTASGAKDWNPSSFSPRTGLVYIPHENLCMDWENLEANHISGTPYVGAEVHMKPGPGGHRGELTAWDPVMRRPRWVIREDLPLWSGTVATGGDLVFYGTMDGWFKAVDARDGRLRWRAKLDSGIISQPISYRGPDGHQYIAVLTGVGGWAGAVVSGNLDPRDGSSALGFVNTMTDLPHRTPAGGTLRISALPH